MTAHLTTTYRRIEHRDHTAFLTTATIAAESSVLATDKAVLAPRVVGVCRSDLREINGTRFGRSDFGHEIVGDVLDTSPALADLRGRTVVFDPHPKLARRTSGFAELVELTGDSRQLRAALIPIPVGLPDRVAVFTEPLACAVHCATRLHTVTADLALAPETTIAVYGAGMAGTLISAVLTATGHKSVLLNPSGPRLVFLRRRHALPSRAFESRHHRPPFQRVVVATATATQQVLATCLDMLADDGLLMLFAGTQPGDRLGTIDIDQVRRTEDTQLSGSSQRYHLAGTHGADRADFHTALTLLQQAPDAGWSPSMCVKRLTTQILELDAAADHLTASAAHGGLGKTIIQIRPPDPLES
ncbi:hypothetical protein [Nocardia ignorata]|uniref:Threonine dehydrogenase-like Zn-dependent dehydrogenase n=1 Tax=Nocardia ignorata TaxID=145285 RepID=A0A4R6NXL5_NOCIG|nr:hypothetical protein [Nocardia ignorata]TDP28225.1 threonine dehydrogenase-like Zn-dependent dehydrogenase [Nocardia ignorata]